MRPTKRYAMTTHREHKPFHPPGLLTCKVLFSCEDSLYAASGLMIVFD